MTKPKCQLDKPPFYQCCCVCANHFNVVDNDNLMPTKRWICTLPVDMGKESWSKDKLLAVIECVEHSCGCECWNDTRKRDFPT
jgi:hypothetical protein